MRWFLVLLLVSACDDLNKPMNHPSSPRPLDPSSSSSSSSSSSGGAPADDAGTTSDGAAPAAPAPTITAAPGDIHI